MSNLLQLVMIVKNAANSIENTLKSYKPYISWWCILDTGSTDGTLDLIRKTMLGIPGELYEEPFVTFPISRNRALDLAGTHAIFSIMPDDTYELNGGDKLLKILGHASERDESIISIKIHDHEGVSYSSKRITRTSSGVRYQINNKIHEDVGTSEDQILMVGEEDVFLYDRLYSSMIQRSKKRWVSDIEILEEQLKEDPKNPRPYYYLGMTHYALEDSMKAIEYFEKRIQFNDDHTEERFESLMNLGILKCQTSSLEDGLVYFTRACKLFPLRAAEPLYQLALIHNKEAKETSDPLLSKFYADQFFTLLLHAAQYNEPSMHSTIMFVNKQLYRKMIPNNLAIEAIKRDYFEIAKQQLDKLIVNDPKNQETQAMRNFVIYSLQTKYLSKYQTVTHDHRRTVVFVTGGYYSSWNGNTKALGGSETMLAIQAEQLVKQNYRVLAFVQCDPMDQQTIRGVEYRSNQDFGKFVLEFQVDHCIISRFTEYLGCVNQNKNVKNVYFWCHDVLPHGTPICSQMNFRQFILLLKWHKQILMKELSLPEKMIRVIDNSIDLKRFENPKGIKKIPWSFIFSSSSDRDLDHLLEMFPNIRKAFPEAVLHVYTELERGLVNHPDILKRIQKLLPTMKNYVFLHPRVDQAVLSQKFLESEFWIYPNRVFTETYCITALEAQAAGCICISTNLSGMGTTLDSKRGLSLDPENCNANYIVRKLKDLTPQIKYQFLKNCKEYAQQHDVAVIGKQFGDLLREYENSSEIKN